MLRYKFSILLAIVIALLSLAPASSFPHTSVYNIPFIDKAVHVLMYGSLGFVALMESRCIHRCFGLYFIILFAILLSSAIIEILQATLISSRGAEWFDLLANFSGIIFSCLAFRLVGGWKIFHFLKS